jgi:gamma-glutamylcyclotransferase (GGCT)/AIG2-like uncharacterized protein YtfP
LIPFFVYSNLRTGYKENKDFFGGKIEKVVLATLSNYDMYECDGYPGVISGDRDVVGELIYVEATHYLTILKELDSLHQYSIGKKSKSLFFREIIKVELEDDSLVDSYVYTLNSKLYKDLDLVKSGDWKKSNPAVK